MSEVSMYDAIRTLSVRLLSGATSAIVVMSLHGLFGSVHWFTITGYLIIGFLMASSAWVFEKIWLHSVAQLSDGWNTMITWCSQLPFWYLAGGAGYVAGMVIAKKIGLMGYYDTPLRPIFHFGARAGTVVQAVFVTFVYGKLYRYDYSQG